MYKVNVMYPNEDGVKFNFDYYCDTHMPLVEKNLKPYGLLRTSVEKGISGGAGQKAPYVCIGSLYFERADGYDEGVKQIGPVLREDIPNFTNVTPTRIITEVME